MYAQVYDARPIKKSNPRVKAILPKRVVGAKMYLYAEKGVTAGYLQRAALCHANATEPEYEYESDPLRVEGDIKSLRVYSLGNSFVIAVTSKDNATGREIWRRAQTVAQETDSASAERQVATDM